MTRPDTERDPPRDGPLTGVVFALAIFAILAAYFVLAVAMEPRLV